MPTANTSTPHGPRIEPVPAGFGRWEPVGLREFERANRDGLPTLAIEFRNDDQFRDQYYVARYLPGRSLR